MEECSLKKMFKVIAVVLLSIGLLSSVSGNASAANLGLKNLGIYYGYPSLVNGANGDLTKATEAFKPYQTVVFGDLLEIPENDPTENANTKTITQNLRANGNDVYGYVSIGCSDQLNSTEIKNRVDQWASMSANGVFYDCYGFDYGVTRAKQNELVDYAHSKGLKVFANAWVPEDAMGGKDESGNASPTHLNSNDHYLMESFVSEGSGTLQPTSEWVKKADAALALSKSTGVKIDAISTVSSPGTVNVNDAKYKIASYASAMYGFDSFQWSDDNYASDSNKLYKFALPTNYGTTFTEDVVTHNSDYTVMTRKTDTGQFKVTQNSTTKNGEFIAGSTPDLQAQIDALKAENASLKAENATLTDKNATLTSENSKLNDKVSSIKSVFGSFVSSMNDLLN